MSNAHWLWKPIACLVCLVAAGDFYSRAVGPAVPPAAWIGTLGLALAALGVLQYAFGRSWVPKLVWRVFGPLFSVAMIWPLASGIGWLGTRLAIRSLTLTQQAVTAGLLAFLAFYGLAILIPLYRLGEWRRLKGVEPNEQHAALENLFS